MKLTAEAKATVEAGYLQPGETRIEESFSRVAKRASRLLCDDSLQEPLFHILNKGWLGLASPVLSNFGGNSPGLPVSCFANHIGDSVDSIYTHVRETAVMSKVGGGVGTYLGDIRPAGAPFSNNGISGGLLPWANTFDQVYRTVSQGSLRRGSGALYCPIDHPDVQSLLRAKDHSQGDVRGHLDCNLAVTIKDGWMQDMLAGDKAKQDLFLEVLKTRLISGSPYIVFIDTVNRDNPVAYKANGLEVSTSNLCSEITLHTDDNHSFVCVLSSLNLSKFRDWQYWRSERGETVVSLAIKLLEAVTTDFLIKSKNIPGLEKARRSAEKGRALGLGVMGLHTLYQSEGLPFESRGARTLNKVVHRHISSQALETSKRLAKEFGEPEWCEGTGLRHTHLTAIAPTKTNSIITNAGSEGVEPLVSNFFVAKSAKGSFVRKNPFLIKALEEVGYNNQEVWQSIADHQGSVQHLPFLNSDQKEVFKTAIEIDQTELVRQAAERQQYICQSQSLNLFVRPDISLQDLLKLHVGAWQQGVKSLYYCKSQSLNLPTECLRCQG